MYISWEHLHRPIHKLRRIHEFNFRLAHERAEKKPCAHTQHTPGRHLELEIEIMRARGRYLIYTLRNINYNLQALEQTVWAMDGPCTWPVNIAWNIFSIVDLIHKRECDDGEREKDRDTRIWYFLQLRIS